MCVCVCEHVCVRKRVCVISQIISSASPENQCMFWVFLLQDENHSS